MKLKIILSGLVAFFAVGKVAAAGLPEFTTGETQTNDNFCCDETVIFKANTDDKNDTIPWQSWPVSALPATTTALVGVSGEPVLSGNGGNNHVNPAVYLMVANFGDVYKTTRDPFILGVGIANILTFYFGCYLRLFSGRAPDLAKLTV